MSVGFPGISSDFSSASLSGSSDPSVTAEGLPDMNDASFFKLFQAQLLNSHLNFPGSIDGDVLFSSDAQGAGLNTTSPSFPSLTQAATPFKPEFVNEQGMLSQFLGGALLYYDLTKKKLVSKKPMSLTYTENYLYFNLNDGTKIRLENFSKTNDNKVRQIEEAQRKQQNQSNRLLAQTIAAQADASLISGSEMNLNFDSLKGFIPSDSKKSPFQGVQVRFYNVGTKKAQTGTIIDHVSTDTDFYFILNTGHNVRFTEF